MDDFPQIVDRYIAMWNEVDGGARRRLIEELWSATGRYVDPLTSVEGRAAINDTVEAAQKQFSGITFRLAGPVDAHHQQARFGWELGTPGEEPIVVGFDVAECDQQGRLAVVLGFLDKVPAM
ncbi:MAG TPA: nuclear transport factor 2 family protein [Candidatus Dormibacteraeota bacterium]|jgi:hypothetical protein|nr:nuclear transport factor 2 family protein [Candidatus Dormibacteraeota bacterium]